MDFRLNIMGAASAMPVVNRHQSAHVLEICGRSFLIDCGEGVQTQMMKNRISILRLDGIFISHIHGDHLFGLLPLLSTLGMMCRRVPLHIYGPNSLGPVLKFFLSYYGTGLAFDIEFHPVDCKQPELIYENRTMEILAFPLNHKIETFGYLFREKTPQRNVSKAALARYDFTLSEIGRLKAGEDVVRPAGDEQEASFLNSFTKFSGTDEPLVIRNEEVTYLPFLPRSFAYCSDTAPFHELSEWIRDVDLLYHETTYLAEYADLAVSRYHSTTLDAAAIALKAGVKKLVIGHYSSRCRDKNLYENECRTIFKESYAADDGDVFDVALKKYEG